MLENLMGYLAVVLPQMRAVDSTLGREAALTESYLAIQRIRMGNRLAFDIAIPEPLRNERVPAMMLLTLAENAIKHGLAPLPEGGQVRISATVSGSPAELTIVPSGVESDCVLGDAGSAIDRRVKQAVLPLAAARELDEIIPDRRPASPRASELGPRRDPTQGGHE